jgi:uncharacterized protein (TIGR02217 family)
MSFAEVRLPVNVERGAKGGPAFLTKVLTLYSGFERRNQLWSSSRGEWNVGFGISSKTQFHQFLHFFMARRGKFQGFRFKDWSDFESTDEQIGVGNGSTLTFQLVKTYSDELEINNYVRNIKKPVDGTVVVKVNSVITAVTINYSTGIVTFSPAPAIGLVITWSGEFDVPVRFDDDDFGITLENFNAGNVPNINIVELK